MTVIVVMVLMVDMKIWKELQRLLHQSCWYVAATECSQDWDAKWEYIKFRFNFTS